MDFAEARRILDDAIDHTSGEVSDMLREQRVVWFGITAFLPGDIEHAHSIVQPLLHEGRRTHMEFGIHNIYSRLAGAALARNEDH